MTYPVTFNFVGDSSQILVDTMGIVKLSYDTVGSKDVVLPIEAIFERDGKVEFGYIEMESWE